MSHLLGVGVCIFNLKDLLNGVTYLISEIVIAFLSYRLYKIGRIAVI